MKNLIVIILALTLVTSLAHADDWEKLCKDGYAVVARTNVEGEFEGCDFDKQIPLMNGLVFVCSEYSYSYSYMPEVFILKHIQNGNFKVVIDDEGYDGTLYKR